MDKNLEKGIELIRQVENTAAISFLEKALNNDPQNPEIYRHLGLAYFNSFLKVLIGWFPLRIVFIPKIDSKTTYIDIVCF